MPSTPHCGFFGVSPDGNCAYVHWGSFTSNSKSVRRAIWFTWVSEPHDSVYGTWQSQAVTHPIMNRARRRLTSVIEHKPLSERRIPYVMISRQRVKLSGLPYCTVHMWLKNEGQGIMKFLSSAYKPILLPWHGDLEIRSRSLSLNLALGYCGAHVAKK